MKVIFLLEETRRDYSLKNPSRHITSVSKMIRNIIDKRNIGLRQTETSFFLKISWDIQSFKDNEIHDTSSLVVKTSEFWGNFVNFFHINGLLQWNSKSATTNVEIHLAYDLNYGIWQYVKKK